MPEKGGARIGLLVILCLTATCSGIFDSRVSNNHGTLSRGQEISLASNDVLGNGETIGGKKSEFEEEGDVGAEGLNKRIKLAGINPCRTPLCQLSFLFFQRAVALFRYTDQRVNAANARVEQ